MRAVRNYKKIMKQLLLFPFILLSLSIDYSSDPPRPDLAAVYCKFLEYDLITRKDLQGNEYGICIFPNGSECGEWDFFHGTCGQEFSYCARKWCETLSVKENKGSYDVKYCACSCIDSLGNKKVTPLIEFMAQNGDTLIKENSKFKGKY
jgi:hypothetical protein